MSIGNKTSGIDCRLTFLFNIPNFCICEGKNNQVLILFRLFAKYRRSNVNDDLATKSQGLMVQSVKFCWGLLIKSEGTKSRMEQLSRWCVHLYRTGTCLVSSAGPEQISAKNDNRKCRLTSREDVTGANSAPSRLLGSTAGTVARQLYLLRNFLYTLLELMHHVTHLQSFIGAQLVEVMVMGHALVKMPQGFPPRHQQLQDHRCQLFSLQRRQDGGLGRRCPSVVSFILRSWKQNNTSPGNNNDQNDPLSQTLSSNKQGCRRVSYLSIFGCICTFSPRSHLNRLYSVSFTLWSTLVSALLSINVIYK